MCALSPRLRHVLHPIRALPPSHSALCPSVLLPPQSDSCQHALGHVMSVLPHHPRKPAYSTRPNPILDAASSSPQGYLASSPPVKMPQHFHRLPGLSRRVCVHFARCACVSQFDPRPSGRPIVWRDRSCDGKVSHHHARIARLRYRWLPFDHAPCLCPVSCSRAPVRVFYPLSASSRRRSPDAQAAWQRHRSGSLRA